MSLIYAPWTDEQVAALNRWQDCDWVHPFTCGKRDTPDHKLDAKVHGKHDHGILIATTNGWQCPVCDYTQNWAHDFMLNPPRNILVDWDYQDRKKPK